MPFSFRKLQPPRKKADDDLCDRVKALRAKMGITQEEMGKMIGVSKDAIRTWESHKRAPTRRTKLRGQIRRRIRELELLASQVNTDDRSRPVSFRLPKRKREEPIRVG